MKNKAFSRNKIIYLVVIVALIFPLSMLGMPATGTGENRVASGMLASIRDEHGLGTANLGKVDPSGASMQLAMLGMKNVAAHILWSKALHYGKTEQFDKVSATVKQIVALHPYFFKVWDFEAHNLSYNISAQFDDVEVRYHWLKKGTSFMMEGFEYNANQSRFPKTIARHVGSKIDKADEKIQYRQYFRDDKAFHDELDRMVEIDSSRGIDQKPHHWLVSRLWSKQMVDLLDSGKAHIETQTPVLVYSAPAKAYSYYSKRSEESGHFDAYIKNAWKRTERDWVEFASRSFPTLRGGVVKIEDLVVYQDQQALANERLTELVPGVREKLYEERLTEILAEPPFNGLSEAEMPPVLIPEYEMAKRRARVLDEEVFLARIPEEHRAEAKMLIRRSLDLSSKVFSINQDIASANYLFFREEYTVEQQESALKARELFYKAKIAANNVVFRGYVENGVQVDGAKELFEKGFAEWDKVEFINPVAGYELIGDEIQLYWGILAELEIQFPEKLFETEGLQLRYQEIYEGTIRRALEDNERNNDNGNNIN
ncbi:MAG: hypothetical protein MPJ24_04085 [Pirellulaceae bacterium]|nr:hypothetical protein [Pirellulaceae bacterium]